MSPVQAVCGVVPFPQPVPQTPLPEYGYPVAPISPTIFISSHPFRSSHRRFGELDNFRYERASCQNEKTFANTKRVDAPKCRRRWSWQMEDGATTALSALDPPTSSCPKSKSLSSGCNPRGRCRWPPPPPLPRSSIICTAVATSPDKNAGHGHGQWISESGHRVSGDRIGEGSHPHTGLNRNRIGTYSCPGPWLWLFLYLCTRQRFGRMASFPFRIAFVFIFLVGRELEREWQATGDGKEVPTAGCLAFPDGRRCISAKWRSTTWHWE